jgi:phosphate transport system substrate-binding protein
MTLRKQALICASVLLCSIPLFAQATRIGGSYSLIYLGQRFTEQYRAKHPDAQFTVQGGGSIASKAADLDIVQVEGSGPMGKRLAFPIAIHEIVIYVNKANPVRELSMGQVRSIFLGQITNWKELGGPDRRINLFAGESTTGNTGIFPGGRPAWGRALSLRGQKQYSFAS